MHVGTDATQAAHRRNLEDEEIGVRHRILNYYLPLFHEFCKAHGRRPDEIRILDCGCGGGTSVEYLANGGFRAVGIDVASFRHQQWKERGSVPRTAFVQADAVMLPFASHSFDIVLSSGMLEHIGVAEEFNPQYRVKPLPDQVERRRGFIGECLRVLRPHGIVYIDHPNGSFPIDFWHSDYTSRPRFHSPKEKFLPNFTEVVKLAKSVNPICTVTAISPAGRFTFRRSQRRWYGKLLTVPFEFYLALLRWPLSALARSPLNPYLVIRISSDTQ